MKGILVTTDDKMTVKEYGEPLFHTVGASVGGYIEVVRPAGLEDPFVLIVNEEGLLDNLPLNRFGSTVYGTAVHGNPIVGDIVIMREGYNDDGEPDILGLRDKDVVCLKKLLEIRFRIKEM